MLLSNVCRFSCLVELQSSALASSVWVTSVCVLVSSPQIECARIQDVGPRSLHLWTPCSTGHCLSQRKHMTDTSWWIIPFFSFLSPVVSHLFKHLHRGTGESPDLLLCLSPCCSEKGAQKGKSKSCFDIKVLASNAPWLWGLCLHHRLLP